MFAGHLPRPNQFWQLRVIQCLQGDLVMRKVTEYELRSEECRRLAAHMKDPEQKKQLEDMAQAWELLARARMKHLQRGWNEPPASK